MKIPLNTQNHVTLSQQINHSFFVTKGCDSFENLHSHDCYSIYDSYLSQHKSIASSITHQNCSVSFVSKFTKPRL